MTKHHPPAPSRSLNLCIFPVAVFGRDSTTSIQRGYFHAPIFCLTCSFSASFRPSVLASARSTTNAFGFKSPSGSASGTTAASSTAGWVISALSTSNGDTQMPEARLPGVADRFRQRLAGGGADAQALAGALVLQRPVVQHRREQRRHAEEDGRIIFVEQREHRRRRRAVGIEHGGGADRHRKGQ